MALALTARRSTVAALVSIVAAMALAVAVAGRSCRVSQPGPEAAVRDMLRAAMTGDRDTVYDLLGPETHKRLEAEARRASDMVGATLRYTAKDLVSLGSSEGVIPPSDITVLEETDDSAVVLVVRGEDRATMQLVRSDDRWLVEIPQYSRPTDH
jgi:hypothetical protein